MEFRLLGPVQVVAGGRPLPVNGAHQRALLALLLLHPNRVVAADRLVGVLWTNGAPSKAARHRLQVRTSELRRVLADAGEDERLAYRPPGYVLRVGPGELDLDEFVRLADQGREQLTAGHAERARKLLAEALGRWHGRALEDVDLPGVRREAERLEARRLAVAEDRIEAELACGRHAEMVAELEELAAAEPLRERLHAQLMLALYRSDRQADALAVFRRLRDRLVAEVGVEPGPSLQELQRQLLNANPALRPAPEPVTPQRPARPAPATVPSELPPDVASFTGRQDELAELERAVATVDRAGPVAITAIQGAGGVGKSALAVHAAHRLAGRFPDGQLYANLQGATPGSTPLAPLEVLLASLDGAAVLHLDVLPPVQAVELLGRLAGPQRVAAEPQAAGAIAELCGRLPLAVRIVGARLAVRTNWRLERLRERLALEHRRLDELELADLGVRASFAVSLRQLHDSPDRLDRAAAGAFALLGLPGGADLGVPAAARLLDLPDHEAERVLERLADAHLLETPSPGRYHLHDLLRLYAREEADRRHPEGRRAAALTRLLGFYTASAWRTLALLRPGDYRLDRADQRWTKGGLEFPDDKAALLWLEAERANLLAAVDQAAAMAGVTGTIASQLAQGLFGFFLLRGYWHDCVRVNQPVLDLARQTGDRAAQAQALIHLGVASARLGRHAEAIASYRDSLAICRELGDRHGEGASLNNLSLIHERLGRYDEALACLEASLAIDRELGDRRGQSISLNNLGFVNMKLGNLDQALRSQEESLAIARELHDSDGQAQALNNLGGVHMRLGRLDEALACERESLVIYRELGDRDGQAQSLHDLGMVYERQGRHDQALACLRESLTFQRELGSLFGEAETLEGLGTILRALGRFEEALALWREALPIFERLQMPDAERVRALLAAVQRTGAGAGPQRSGGPPSDALAG